MPTKQMKRVVTSAKQKPPFHNPLPYHVYGGEDTQTGVFSASWQPQVLGMAQDSGCTESSIAYRKAYDRFVSRAKGYSASWGENFAERKKSFEMLADRAIRLTVGIYALKRGQPREALEAWGFKSVRRKRNSSRRWVRMGRNGKVHTIKESRVTEVERRSKQTSKDFASQWLEWHFGWSPLISEIIETTKIFSRPHDPVGDRITGTATESKRVLTQSSSDYWANTYRERIETECLYGWRIQATVSVSSYPLFKANQLGIVNPVATAWALVPMSWFTDYFLDLGRWLESYTDFVGMSLTDPQVSYRARAKGTRAYAYQPSNSNEWKTDGWSSSSAFVFKRTLGLPSAPSLKSRRGTGIGSWSRAATAVAVLAGFFSTSTKR